MTDTALTRLRDLMRDSVLRGYAITTAMVPEEELHALADLLEAAPDWCDAINRVFTIADETCGLQPVQPIAESLSAIEAEIFNLRKREAEAERERDAALARAEAAEKRLKFQEHLNQCRQCRERPFTPCPFGAAALKAVMETAIVPGATR